MYVGHGSAAGHARAVRLDRANRSLRRGLSVIPLRQLLAAVWPDTAVTDTVVANAWNDTDDLVRAARELVSPRSRLLSRYRLSSARTWFASAAARVAVARAAATRPAADSARGGLLAIGSGGSGRAGSAADSSDIR